MKLTAPIVKDSMVSVHPPTQAPLNDPFLAFAFFLCTLVCAIAVIMFIGDVVNISLVRYALPLALPPSLLFTYGHFFSLSRHTIIVGLVLASLLVLLGMAAHLIVDFNWDGMAYHQPAIQEILDGYNLLRNDSTLRQINLYPSIAWSVEAALAAWLHSVEAAKILNVGWLFIAMPVLQMGVRNVFGSMPCYRNMLLVLLVLNPIVVWQCFTHLVDAMIYLTGLVFVGAALMHVYSLYRDRLSLCFMAMALFFLLNLKLSGIYHAMMLCSAIILYAWIQHKTFPWKMAKFLAITCIVCTCVFGYKVYVYNTLHYASTIAALIKTTVDGDIPTALLPLPHLARFVYVLSSVYTPEELSIKWPWVVIGSEWSANATSGFGPLFALGLLLALVAVGMQRNAAHKGILSIAFIMLLFSVAFPISWPVRYEPFIYAVPFLMLLALPSSKRIMLYAVIGILMVNTVYVLKAASFRAFINQTALNAAVEDLKARHIDHVYLSYAYGGDYRNVNHAYITIQRILGEHGINASVKNVPCTHEVIRWAGFKVCG